MTRRFFRKVCDSLNARLHGFRVNLSRTGQEQELTEFLAKTFTKAELADVLNQFRQAEVHSVEELKALTKLEKEFDNKIPNDTLRTRLQNLFRPGMCHPFVFPLVLFLTLAEHCAASSAPSIAYSLPESQSAASEWSFLASARFARTL